MTGFSEESLRAVLFDVDFTLCHPGTQLGPLGYRDAGARLGLALNPALYEQARLVAIENLERHPELDHDQEVWRRFTEDVVRGMGGNGDAVTILAEEIVLGWEVHQNFEFYEDALPVLRRVREHGYLLGLVSNTSRDLDEFVAYYGIEVDAVITSRVHGKMKPHPSIFMSVLDALDVAPSAAVMVGDSYEDDIEGARALGMHAVLIDRSGATTVYEPTICTLDALLPLLRAGFS